MDPVSTSKFGPWLSTHSINTWDATFKSFASLPRHVSLLISFIVLALVWPLTAEKESLSIVTGGPTLDNVYKSVGAFELGAAAHGFVLGGP